MLAGVVIFSTFAAPLASQGSGTANTARGELIGAVIDSVHGGMLTSATVTIAGTSRHEVTDADGRFHFDSMAAGTYTLTVSHPLLDTLGMELSSRPVAVVANRVVIVALATPSRGSIRRTLCPRVDTLATPGFIAGRLRNADTDAPAAGISVSVAYSDFQVSRVVGVHQLVHVRKATVDADGKYVICGLPARFKGTLQAMHGTDITAEVLVTLDAANSFAFRSMTIGASPAASLANGANAQSGLATLTGHVVDGGGLPLTGAEASVTGAHGSATTNERGEFSLQSLPSGTQELVVRKVGYQPVTQIVELTRRESRRADVTMALFAPTLATVKVTGVMEKGLTKVGFLDRKKAGMGYYLTPTAIDSLHPQKISDLLGAAPGIIVTTGDWGTQIQSTRTTAAMRDACVNFYIDNAPWSSTQAGDLDTNFPVSEIAAIEVYGGTAVPSEFTVPGKSCATVVVWTRTTVGRH